MRRIIRNSDDRIRDLERRAAQGDRQASALLVAELVRAGRAGDVTVRDLVVLDNPHAVFQSLAEIVHGERRPLHPGRATLLEWFGPRNRPGGGRTEVGERFWGMVVHTVEGLLDYQHENHEYMDRTEHRRLSATYEAQVRDEFLGLIEEFLANPTLTITPAEAMEADYYDFGPSHRAIAWGLAESVRRALARAPGDPNRIVPNGRYVRSDWQ